MSPCRLTRCLILPIDFQAQFLRLKARRGGKKAAIAAVAASILTTAYHMLTDDSSQLDLASGVIPLVSPASSQIALVASARKSTSEPPHDTSNSSFKVVHFSVE